MSGVIRITVTGTKGSAPRGAGTSMQVWADRSEGTIGGGQLEWAAMAEARAMLADGRQAHKAHIALGPGLGQCCGGAVSLRWEAAKESPEPPRRPVWIYGAGHVGRALVHVLAPLPVFSITWVDTAADRFPVTDVDRLVADNPARAASHAPPAAAHLIMTYSHEIDLSLCHVLLQRDCHSIGLIGSATKWARFRSRLRDLGHDAAALARVTCPIGDPALGRHPAAIAVGVATAMIRAETTAIREALQ